MKTHSESVLLIELLELFKSKQTGGCSVQCLCDLSKGSLASNKIENTFLSTTNGLNEWDLMLLLLLWIMLLLMS